MNEKTNVFWHKNNNMIDFKIKTPFFKNFSLFKIKLNIDYTYLNVF
jgi:hypothetical protein